MKVTKRQEFLYQLIAQNDLLEPAKALKVLQDEFGTISRMSLARDIQKLAKLGLVSRVGHGRGTRYSAKKINKILRFVDPETYFSISPDERTLASKNFDDSLLSKMDTVFTPSELEKLSSLNVVYAKRVDKYAKSILKKEYERLTVELSWKSSKMEGNTYTLIDTEVLIKEGKKAKGKTAEETLMILNHKQAIDYIFEAQKSFKKITLHQIENIHSLLVQGMDIGKGLRSQPVGIIGTKYHPPDNRHQTRDAMELFVKSINRLNDPFTKSLAAILFISYIQPFEDGNKRTARLLGNAILLANDCCPISYRSTDEADYKKALIIFYEQHSALMFKRIFIEQFSFAVNNYFL